MSMAAMLAFGRPAVGPPKMGNPGDGRSSFRTRRIPRPERIILTMPTALPAAESSLDAIARLADEGLSAQELLEQAAVRIERVVPTDGYFMAAADPETTLVLGTGL